MDFNFFRKFSLLMLLCTLVSTFALAQERKVTGRVLDSLGAALPGVNVSLKGLPSNVSTNKDGVYTIQVRSNNDILVFSFVGYIRKQVAVGAQTSIEVRLSEENSKLNDVVVVGYGTKKRNEILGSVATVTGQELQDIPASNISASLRNRVAGVGVSQVSGRPGSPTTLNIRGASFSDRAQGQSGVSVTNEPLYIIDGITVTREQFDNIDASMVENITFLKDASSAIYGASGAKGVVLVTTKRGKIGKPTLTYNGYMGVSDATYIPKMMSAYDQAAMLTEGDILNGKAYSTMFSAADLEYLKGVNYKSWFDEMWQSSQMQRHNIGIQGGSDRVTFFAGGSFQKEDGNWKGLTFDKYSFRSGLTANIATGLKADVAFNVDWNITDAKYNATDADANYFRDMITVPKWVPISQNGLYTNKGKGTALGFNPLAELESGYYKTTKSKGYRINANLTYEAPFLKGLTARFQISQGSNFSNNRQYTPNYTLYSFERFGNNGELFTDRPNLTIQNGNPVLDVNGIGNRRIIPGLSEANSYQAFATVQYVKTIAKHSVSLLVGGEQTESNNENISILYTNQLVPGVDDPWAFDASTIASNGILRAENTKRSFFGRLNYDFDKKYLLEVVTRLDASSYFATGNRWGVSPSVGLGWVASSENFFKNAKFLSFVNFLKLKANVGITGDDRVGARLWQDRYSVDVTNGYLYGNSNTNSLNPARKGNPDITWEKKRTVNIGLETSMFNNKLDFSVEYYNNYGYDIFDFGGNSSVPLYGGFLPAVINYGKRYDWGTEFNIGYKAKLAKDLNLSTSLNFAYTNFVIDRQLYAQGDLVNNQLPNWLTSFGTDPRYWNTNNIGLKTIGMFRTQADVDAWMAKYPNYRLNDLIPQPGWLYYEDSNGDGIINESDSRPLFKNINPWFNGGLNLNLSYKAFSLSTNIAARLGGKVFYDSRARTAPTYSVNVLTIWNDRWTPQNPMQGKLPRYDDPLITRNSDYWAVDGTTIRINTMTLSYKAPTKLVNKLGLTGARLILTGNNLWTIVNPLPYKDPYNSSAWDYPILRTLSAGLSVNL